ncbi:MAG: WxcM-like domain-containing protein [Clostridia bacterium]|nr:WxcM-like domain-containing protein [Clostridia bacterium]
MINTEIRTFRANTSEWGSLVALEGDASGSREIPFDIRRVYYIYDVGEGVRRGFHSHSDLEQVLVCVHGSVKILLKTPFEEEVVTLDSPDKGLYIGPMIWREMFDWQDGAVLLVMASKHYDEKDYIRDYAAYEEQAKTYFEARCDAR